MNILVETYALRELSMLVNVEWMPSFGMSIAEKLSLTEDIRSLLNNSNAAYWSQTDFCIELTKLSKYQPMTATQEAFVCYMFLTAYSIEQNWKASNKGHDPIPEKARRSEYERIYDELGSLFDETAKDFIEQYGKKTDTRSFSHILRTRLVTDTVGYFSKRICGEECPDSDWTKAVAVVLGKNVVHCSRIRNCSQFQPIISSETVGRT